MQQYRILTHNGNVHVQKQWTFLWWSGWRYVKTYSRDEYRYVPVEFYTMEKAKEYIDNQLVGRLPPIITPYPAPVFPVRLSKTPWL